jgi:hypothetical protein
LGHHNFSFETFSSPQHKSQIEILTEILPLWPTSENVGTHWELGEHVEKVMEKMAGTPKIKKQRNPTPPPWLNSLET